MEFNLNGGDRLNSWVRAWVRALDRSILWAPLKNRLSMNALASSKGDFRDHSNLMSFKVKKLEVSKNIIFIEQHNFIEHHFYLILSCKISRT